MAIDYVGKTALITGASSGIGEQFARSLAARGANLILVARRSDRLLKLASEIESSTNSRVTCIPVDLAKPTAASLLISDLGSRTPR